MCFYLDLLSARLQLVIILTTIFLFINTVMIWPKTLLQEARKPQYNLPKLMGYFIFCKKDIYFTFLQLRNTSKSDIYKARIIGCFWLTSCRATNLLFNQLNASRCFSAIGNGVNRLWEKTYSFKFQCLEFKTVLFLFIYVTNIAEFKTWCHDLIKMYVKLLRAVDGKHSTFHLF